MSDDAITKERLEAIGFTQVSIGCYVKGLLFVDVDQPDCPVFFGRVWGKSDELPEIKTMTQLTNLIKALRGET